MSLSGCLRVQIGSRVINAMPDVDNVTISKVQKLKLSSRIYESRQGTGKTKEMNEISLSEVMTYVVSW